MPGQELRRRVRKPDYLVGRLPVVLEVELGLRTAVLPVGEGLELGTAEWSPRERGSSHGNAHARRLSLDAGFARDDRGGSHDAARDQTLSALVLAREDVHGVAGRDVLAAVHGLL